MAGIRGKHVQFVCVTMLSAVCAGLPSAASAQQKSPSIDEWLRAERANENLQSAYSAYDRAHYGTRAAPAQQAPQPLQAYPAQPVQTYAPSQAPQHWAPPTYQEQAQAPAQPAPVPTQPQQPAQQPQRYQVPSDALERIDRTYDPDGASRTGRNRFYLTGHMAWPFISSSNFDTSAFDQEVDLSMLAFRAGGGLGYRLTPNLSIELEGSYQFAEFDSANDATLSALSFIPQLKFELDAQAPFTPYVIGGVGLTILNAKDVEFVSTTDTASDSGMAFAYQFGAGVMYPVARNTELDFGYRYFGTADADLKLLGTEYSTNQTSHTLMVGLRHQL